MHLLQKILAVSLFGSTIAFACVPALAQITPDNTLGSEASRVTPNVLINGGIADQIGGGAIREGNLFHSFSEFNIRDGQRVYFANPAGVVNILTRVTGGNASDILGTLGVDGGANLFLMNPNGIIFGERASLNVSGSFAATTANALQFGEQGNFSATSSQPPGLLTVNPSALFFNTLATQGEISSRSGFSNEGGMFASPGRSLLLVGGNVILDGTQIGVIGGRVEIGGVSGVGSVELIKSANGELQLGFAEMTPRADVVLQNNAQIYAIADREIGGGDLAIYGRNLDIRGNSFIRAGIAGFGSIQNQAGDITLNATQTLEIGEESRIANVVDTGFLGNSGDLRITAESVFLSNDARLSTTSFGEGNAGDILIQASDRVAFGENVRIFAESRGVGNGGNIRINTNSFAATNGTALSNSIYGKGNGGDIAINAGDRISLSENVRVNNGIQDTGDGTSGNIILNSGSLLMTDNASINAFTFGKGRGSNILVNASDLVSLDNNAKINSFVDESDGGNIGINTGNLSVKNNASIEAITFGEGNLGNIQIEAKDSISLDGAGIVNYTFSSGNTGNIFLTAGNLVSLNNKAFINNQVREDSSGVGGDIRINAGSLRLANLSFLQTLTGGRGNAGNIIIKASDRVTITDGFNSGERTEIRSSLFPSAKANAGNIEITTNSLEATNLGLITNTSYGEGDAGNIGINANNIWLDDASVFTRVAENAVGRSGDIEVNTGTLTLTNGSQLDTSTFGTGDSGNITVNVRDKVFLSGTALDPTTPEGARSSTLFTEVYPGAIGNGGDIKLNTGSLIMTNAGQIDAKTRGVGNAGNISIDASDRIVLDGARPDESIVTRIINSVQSDGIGQGGNIEITTGSLSVTGGAQILANTVGQGSAGNITIKARDRVSFDGKTPSGRYPSAAFSSVNPNAVGSGGNIRITAKSLFLTNTAILSAATLGEGKAGDVIVNANNLNLSDRAQISVNSQGSGVAGDININANRVELADNAKISAESSSVDGGNTSLNLNNLLLMRRGGQISTNAGTAQQGGNGGNININSQFIVAIPKENSDITANAYTGNGGNVDITTQGIFGIESRSQASNLTNDITASSQLGLQGNVVITEPNVDPVKGVIELPNQVRDRSDEIGRMCPRTYEEAQKFGEFTITGRGGSIPPSILEPLVGAIDKQDLVGFSQPIQQHMLSGSSPVTHKRVSQTQDQPTQIIEAQGWVRGADGKIQLVARLPQAAHTGNHGASCPD